MNVEPTKCPHCGADLTHGQEGYRQDLVCTRYDKCGWYLPAEARELAKAVHEVWDPLTSLAEALNGLAFCEWDDPDVAAKWKALQDRMASDCTA